MFVAIRPLWKTGLGCAHGISSACKTCKTFSNIFTLLLFEIELFESLDWVPVQFFFQCFECTFVDRVGVVGQKLCFLCVAHITLIPNPLQFPLGSRDEVWIKTNLNLKTSCANNQSSVH